MIKESYFLSNLSVETLATGRNTDEKFPQNWFNLKLYKWKSSS